MNILFLTMSFMVRNISERDIYTDLMRKFIKEGHDVYALYPNERRTGLGTVLKENGNWHSLGVHTLNVQKTNVVEKGIGQVLLEYQFKAALKKYFGNVKFDLILYSTPPITFTKVINWAKQRNGAKSYLMLKDIFPQNAVDLGMLTKEGIKGFLYRSFRNKEKELYNISDYIGCMSPANVKYVIVNNKEVNPKKVEICPNSYEVSDLTGDILTSEEKKTIRIKYNLPSDKPIFIYGGNLGKPQGILFLIECLDANKNRQDCHFLVVGNGFEYARLEKWYNENKPKSVSLFQRLSQSDYEKLAASCDVGMIFLDYRFTIPNFPSRLMPYLMGKKPIIACTDRTCDMGEIAASNGFGMSCESNNVDAFTCVVNEMLRADIKEMGERGYQYFLNNYTVDHSYNAIMKHFNNK